MTDKNNVTSIDDLESALSFLASEAMAGRMPIDKNQEKHKKNLENAKWDKDTTSFRLTKKINPYSFLSTVINLV